MTDLEILCINLLLWQYINISVCNTCIWSSFWFSTICKQKISCNIYWLEAEITTCMAASFSFEGTNYAHNWRSHMTIEGQPWWWLWDTYVNCKTDIKSIKQLWDRLHTATTRQTPYGDQCKSMLMAVRYTIWWLWNRFFIMTARKFPYSDRDRSDIELMSHIP